MELGTEVLKRQLRIAFHAGDVTEARRYLNSVVLKFPEMSQVDVTPVATEAIRGNWFVPKLRETKVTMLYLHGGGYSFYARAENNLIALVSLAANSRTFALDYRLSPEHRFPAQLEDVICAYRWLLENGTDPNNLVVAGDSAGGNLTLALLLSIRESNLPQPAIAITLSPATDFALDRALPLNNEDSDWITSEMLLTWADWYCTPEQSRNPLVSPLYADLRGLPPIYIQAGSGEILYDSIRAFTRRAENQGADITLETWADMNHIFQSFGPYAPQSREALRRIGEVVEACRRSRKEEVSKP